MPATWSGNPRDYVAGELITSTIANTEWRDRMMYLKDSPAFTGNVTIAGTLVVTGAITGNLTGNVTGNVTGNASGTAATVTAASQPAITTAANLVSVGTITAGVWNAGIVTSSQDLNATNVLKALHTGGGISAFGANPLTGIGITTSTSALTGSHISLAHDDAAGTESTLTFKNSVGAIKAAVIYTRATDVLSVGRTTAVGLNIIGVTGAASFSSTLTLADTTDSTSITTGSLITAGGVGIAKALWVGGLTNIAGVVTLQNTTDSTSPTTGALIAAGGVGIAKALWVGGELTVSSAGNAAVNIRAVGTSNFAQLIFKQGTTTTWNINARNAATPALDFSNAGGTIRLSVTQAGALTLSGHPAGTPTFAAGDKYLVIDATGNVHVSALGPAS